MNTNDYTRSIIFKLLKKQGKTQQQFADGIGVSKDLVSQWKYKKSDSFRNRLGDIAAFFHVSADVLTGMDAVVNPTGNKEMQKYLEELKGRSEMRMLFKVAQGATKEDVETAVRIIETLKKQ